MKRTLDELKRKLPDVLLSILWAYKMTTHTATREFPFSLAFIMETMVLIEVNVFLALFSDIKIEQNLISLKSKEEMPCLDSKPNKGKQLYIIIPPYGQEGSQ